MFSRALLWYFALALVAAALFVLWGLPALLVFVLLSLFVQSILYLLTWTAPYD